MSDNKAKGDIQGKRIVAGLAFVVVVVFVASVISGIGDPVLDPSTNCMLEKKGGATLKPVRQVAILIDQSELIPEAQRGLIRQYMARVLADNLKQHDRLLLFTFSSADSGALLPKVGFCKPKESANELIEGKFLIGVHLIQEFYLPVSLALNNATTTAVGHESPILEAIQGVVPHVFPWKEPRELIIVSDMLQHSPPYTHYRMLPSDEFDAELQKQGKLKMLANLQGWSVKVLYLSRRDKNNQPLPFQDANHLKFWDEYFKAAGAAAIEMERI